MQPTPIPPPGQPAHTPLIPTDQDEKARLAVFLAEAWAQHPQLVFIWTTQAAFAQLAAAYQQSLDDKADAASLRGGISYSLQEANEKITEGLPYLKAALLAKFKKGKDKAMYPQFGLITRAGGYELPKGQTERAKALQTLLTGLATHGLEAGDYGRAYWLPLAAAYAAGTKSARQNAADVSKHQGTKNTLEDQVDLVLSKMLSLLEAQYPNDDELAAKRRELGYLKEYN